MATGVERFSRALEVKAESWRDRLRDYRRVPADGELFAATLARAMYEGAAVSLREAVMPVDVIYGKGERAGYRASSSAVEYRFPIRRLMNVIVEARRFCLDTAYSLEMTEDERRGVLIRALGFIDGYNYGLVKGILSAAEKASPVTVKERTDAGYEVFFKRIRTPAVVINRRRTVDDLNDGAAAFFNVDPASALNRRCEDVLGLTRRDVSAMLTAAVSPRDVFLRRARVRGHAREAVVKIQVIDMDAYAARKALVFFDLTELEEIKTKLLEYKNR